MSNTLTYNGCATPEQYNTTPLRCDYYYWRNPSPCGGEVTRCSNCGNASCQEHGSTEMELCGDCVSELILAIVCESCHVGNMDGHCACPVHEPVTLEALLFEVTSSELLEDLWGVRV